MWRWKGRFFFLIWPNVGIIPLFTFMFFDSYFNAFLIRHNLVCSQKYSLCCLLDFTCHSWLLHLIWHEAGFFCCWFFSSQKTRFSCNREKIGLTVKPNMTNVLPTWWLITVEDGINLLSPVKITGSSFAHTSIMFVLFGLHCCKQEQNQDPKI